MSHIFLPITRAVSRRSLILFMFLALILVYPGNINGQEGLEAWAWLDKTGEKRPRTDLDTIIAQHALWLSTKGTEGERAQLNGAKILGAKLSGAGLGGADLSGADLGQTDLSGADLSGADLSGAKLLQVDLFKAKLSGANLRGVDLTRAKLIVAELNDADLSGADLSRADLGGAELIRAELIEANLSGADLSGANLSGTNLDDADLSGADLNFAELGLLRFEPKLPPRAETLANVDLSGLYYRTSPHALTLLRAELKSKGMREQERLVTYLIQHWKRRRAQCANKEWDPGRENDCPEPRWSTEAALSYALFELTSSYGLHPGRPLIIALGLIPVFALFYTVIISGTFSDRSGIWKVWSDESRVHKEPNQKEPKRILKKWYSPICWLWALWFSMLSAFHIGWRDLNVGSWLTRMSPGEYTLRATGAAKVISGLQSIISIYLVVLSVLMYFGRRFE